MGKWTVAHTEALCSEKFHTALKKPLNQSGLKLEEFFEDFDPQDQLVQKLIGALVNDIASRKKMGKSSTTMRVSDRCLQATRYISQYPDSYPNTAARSRTTIRARRRQEQAAQAEARGSWVFAYPGGDMSDVTSSSSLNLFDAFNAAENPREEDSAHYPPESSGEYWWRQTLHANDSQTYVPPRPPSHPLTVVQGPPTSISRIEVSRQRSTDRPRPTQRTSLIPGASHPNEPIPRHQRSRSNPVAPSLAFRPVEEDARTDAATVTSATEPPQTFIPAEYDHTITSYTPWQEHLRPESYIAGRMFRSPSPIVSSTTPGEDSPWRDVPPPGGFETIKYKRNLPFRGPSGLAILVGTTLFCGYGLYRVGQGNIEKRELKRESTWARIHLVPLLLAESDRDAYRREQAALAREKEIMKDVPGWEAGKSVYHDTKHVPRETIVVL